MGADAIKVCKGCDRSLPLSDFWRSARRPDGRDSVCAECKRGRRQARLDEERAYARAYYHRTKHRRPKVQRRRVQSVRPRHRRCGTCRQEKPETEFHWKDRAHTQRCSRCKPCAREASREHRQRKPQDPAVQRKNRRAFSMRQYGITIEIYEAMLEAQGGVCAICEQEETATRKGTVRVLSVDHDHETGHVRALVCSKCNMLIGLADDDPGRLEKAARYVRDSRKEWEDLQALATGEEIER